MPKMPVKKGKTKGEKIANEMMFDMGMMGNEKPIAKSLTKTSKSKTKSKVKTKAKVKKKK